MEEYKVNGQLSLTALSSLACCSWFKTVMG
jgi:hypothetical protein